MTHDYNAILADMVATTREAGALTLEHFKRFRDLEIGVKGPGDFVSDADRESETLRGDSREGIRRSEPARADGGRHGLSPGGYGDHPGSGARVRPWRVTASGYASYPRCGACPRVDRKGFGPYAGAQLFRDASASACNSKASRYLCRPGCAVARLLTPYWEGV